WTGSRSRCGPGCSRSRSRAASPWSVRKASTAAWPTPTEPSTKPSSKAPAPSPPPDRSAGSCGLWPARSSRTASKTQLGPDRGGAGRLEAQHLRELRSPAGVLVLPVALPVGGDVAGVADRDAVDVGGVAQHVDDLEGAGLLALDPVGIDRVDDGDGRPLAEV